MNPVRRPLLKSLLVNPPGFPDENHTYSNCCARFFTRSLHSLVRSKAACSAHILAKQPWQISPQNTPDTIEQKRQSRLAAQKQLQIKAGDTAQPETATSDAEDSAFIAAMTAKFTNKEALTKADIDRINVIAAKKVK